MVIGDQKNEKARNNLEYKSKIMGGRSVKLPFRMMVLGDFSPNSKEKEQEIGQRRTWQIDKSTFNQVMAEMAPSLEIVTDNKLADVAEGEEPKKLVAKLEFRSRDDFHPEKLIDQIPELKELAKIRDMVKDLKSRMVRSDDLKKTLESVLRDPEKRKRLESELLASQGGGDGGGGAEPEAKE